MPFQPTYFVKEERRAYTIRSGRVGVLMLHGYMGSPVSSRPMAVQLAAQGLTIHCPLLPGHGQEPNKMHKIHHHAWLAEAEEGLATLRGLCDEIFLMGHSMGSVLGAHLATQNPDIRGLIMLAPLYSLPSRALNYTPVLRYLVPWFYPWTISRLRRLTIERVHDLYPDFDFDDPESLKTLPQISRVPTGSMDEMRKVAKLGLTLWPQLQLPIMILQGGQDIAVKPGNAEKVLSALSSEDKVLHNFPPAGHELMRPSDPIHKKVWPLVSDFITQRINPAS